MLAKDEREIVLTLTDAEGEWTVFTDSKRAASTRLLKVAKALGIAPERTGHGWQFTLPLKAVRFGVPRRLSEEEVAKKRAALKRIVTDRGKTTKSGNVEETTT